VRSYRLYIDYLHLSKLKWNIILKRWVITIYYGLGWVNTVWVNSWWQIRAVQDEKTMTYLLTQRRIERFKMKKFWLIYQLIVGQQEGEELIKALSNYNNSGAWMLFKKDYVFMFFNYFLCGEKNTLFILAFACLLVFFLSNYHLTIVVHWYFSNISYSSFNEYN
jgi:hypothetical protein